MDQNEQEVSLTENTTSLQSDSLTQSPSTDLSSAALQSFRLTAPIQSALKGDSNLPASYDLRDSGVITSIKDQGNSGACWAFGTLKSAESNAIRKGFLTKNHADFSENHLAWFAFHPSERGGDKLITDGFYPISSDVDAAYTWGGSSLIALFTLARWSGVIRIHCTFPG